MVQIQENSEKIWNNFLTPIRSKSNFSWCLKWWNCVRFKDNLSFPFNIIFYDFLIDINRFEIFSSWRERFWIIMIFVSEIFSNKRFPIHRNQLASTFLEEICIRVASKLIFTQVSVSPTLWKVSERWATSASGVPSSNLCSGTPFSGSPRPSVQILYKIPPPSLYPPLDKRSWSDLRQIWKYGVIL